MSDQEKKLRVTAAITREGKFFVARCLEVEVTSQGETIDEAMSNLREAVELYFEDQVEIEIPNTPIIAPLDVEVRP
ncbi:type II toxin-antitoxin system HicB family antitoxin [Alicyclobacillus acidiphilus]|uniref:type II toxin-antitoxin system HicB family antitoxin n=1 Tax=Alicyclobacillus acidiphilus TaxID=182455 RepID=UPI000831AF14|nr:type II toxin-antitoxin system HicB family antitoxin [Alicyclobacillus acidiphilus]